MEKTIEIRQLSIDEFTEIIRNTVKEELNNNPKNEKEFLTRQEVSEMLNITLPSLNKYTREGILQSLKIGNRILYKRDEVISTLEKVKNLKHKRT